MFDPEKFGQAMGEAIRKAVEPLQAEIASLKAQLAAIPEPVPGKDGEPGQPGKDCDMAAVKSMVEEAVKAIPVIKGKDGTGIQSSSLWQREGGGVGVKLSLTDGTSVDFDVPAGKSGDDGLGMAGAMIDRDGALQITMTNGEVKNLGVVVGKDGSPGKDGEHGVSLDSFDMDYIEETHEVRIKATCGTRTKELRYPAGGIRAGGYWREGTKALAGQVFTHDGSTWAAKSATTAKPSTDSEDWILMARKGRDGETTIKHVKDGPPEPIKLKG